MATRKFKELTKDWSAERRAKVEQSVKEAIAAMPLDDLRRAREMTQIQLADALGVGQGEVSKIEHRDIRVSTLNEYVEALGGRLEIRAVFPDSVRIIEFEKVSK